MDEQSQDITLEDVLRYLTMRQQAWLGMSIDIANTMQPAWDVLTKHITATHGMTKLLLVDLKFDAIQSTLTYEVTDEPNTAIISIPIPLSIAIDPTTNNQLDAYLTKLPPATVDYKSLSPKDKLKAKFETFLLQTPGLYVNVDRMVELELENADGKFVKFPPIETVQ